MLGGHFERFVSTSVIWTLRATRKSKSKKSARTLPPYIGSQARTPFCAERSQRPGMARKLRQQSPNPNSPALSHPEAGLNLSQAGWPGRSAGLCQNFQAPGCQKLGAGLGAERGGSLHGVWLWPQTLAGANQVDAENAELQAGKPRSISCRAPQRSGP